MASGLKILLITKFEATATSLLGTLGGINYAKNGTIAIGDLVNAINTSGGFLIMNEAFIVN